MKVKDFLDWFSDFDPESELEFDLFEEKIIGWGDYAECHTPLDATDIDCLDATDEDCLDATDEDCLVETDTVIVTLEWGD